MAQSRGVSLRPGGDRSVSREEVGPGARLSRSRSDSPTSGATTASSGSARMATRTGSSTEGFHGSAHREHLGGHSAAAGRSSRSLRSGLVDAPRSLDGAPASRRHSARRVSHSCGNPASGWRRTARARHRYRGDRTRVGMEETMMMFWDRRFRRAPVAFLGVLLVGIRPGCVHDGDTDERRSDGPGREGAAERLVASRAHQRGQHLLDLPAAVRPLGAGPDWTAGRRWPSRARRRRSLGTG